VARAEGPHEAGGEDEEGGGEGHPYKVGGAPGKKREGGEEHEGGGHVDAEEDGSALGGCAGGDGGELATVGLEGLEEIGFAVGVLVVEEGAGAVIDGLEVAHAGVEDVFEGEAEEEEGGGAEEEEVETVQAGFGHGVKVSGWRDAWQG